jgi:hypothetical protein
VLGIIAVVIKGHLTLVKAGMAKNLRGDSSSDWRRVGFRWRLEVENRRAEMDIS